MSKRDRAEAFTAYVGMELKGQIVAHGMTAKTVSETMKRSPAAFNRWLNGKSEIPLTVLCEACEIIDIDPQEIVSRAYDRMAVSLGERDGHTYEADVVQFARLEAVKMGALADDDPDYSTMSEGDAKDYGLAAHKGDPDIGFDDLPHEP